MERRLKVLLAAAMYYSVTDIHFSLNLISEKITIEMRSKDEMIRLKPQDNDVAFFHYLMYRANLDVCDTFLPQTGSMEETIDNLRLSLRFAVVTSYHVTSGVLRILNNHRKLEIDDLTDQKEVRQWLKKIPLQQDGLFLFCGKTGMGKTTTLYTILNSCKDQKIFTLEDPVEIVNENYVQLQINEKQHLSYAEGIKQLLRHDPDILMIGEIRDDEAAKMAVRCALTGHLVISSIHSASCVSAILRMMDLGVKETELKDVLKGISTQKLLADAHGNRSCIYEVMDEEEIDYYFAHHEHSEGYRTMETELKEFYERKKKEDHETSH